MPAPLRTLDLATAAPIAPGANQRVWVGTAWWAVSGDLTTPHAHGPVPAGASVIARPDPSHRVWVGGVPALLVSDVATCGCVGVSSPALPPTRVQIG